MIQGKTSTGFEFKLEDDVLDDYELLEALTAVDAGQYGKVTEMVERLLGTEQKEQLKGHVRSLYGKVAVTKLLEEVEEIFDASNELKN